MKTVENIFERYGNKLLSIGFEVYMKYIIKIFIPCHLVLENIGHVGIVWEINLDKWTLESYWICIVTLLDTLEYCWKCEVYIIVTFQQIWILLKTEIQFNTFFKWIWIVLKNTRFVLNFSESVKWTLKWVSNGWKSV